MVAIHCTYSERNCRLIPRGPVNKILREINLGWNGIGDAGAQAIGEALKANTSLATLILHNKIGDAGATAIAKAPQSLQNLVCLQ
eukprot:g26000.t1